MFAKVNLKKIVFLLVMLAGAVLFSFNMFNFPAYREDEGTYVSQAWSLLKLKQMAPYTYWYDHAPGGWMFMSLWHRIVGFFNLGLAVNTGRVFMLVLFLLSGVLVYKITKKITGNFLASLLALTIFLVSPLGITLFRRVFLDNIMIFWLLLSLNFLVGKKPKLTEVMLSGLTFGIAVLSKEAAIIFFPLLAFVSYKNSFHTNKNFAFYLWLAISFSIILLYPLFALFKEEMFPTGSFLGGDHPHVSLLEAIQFQTQRSGGFFLNPDSDFQRALRGLWLREDPWLIWFGFISLMANLFLFKRRGFLLISGVGLIYLIYLIRGGAVFDWYIIPSIPLFAISIGLFYFVLLNLFKKKNFYVYYRYFLFFLILTPFLFQVSQAKQLFYGDQTINQVKAVEWIADNLPSSAVIVMDNYAYVDLHDPDSAYGTFPNAHYYWKVEQDPAVRLSLLHDQWQNADYILFTRAIAQTIDDEGLSFIQEIYNNSTPIVTFEETAYIPEPYRVEIREVNSERKYLRFSWEWYKRKFILPSGQVIDPQQQPFTTSEGQSYALLRAVWMNDKETFVRVWNWTKDNLQGSYDSYLFSWLAGESENGIADEASAADADIDIALSLLFASKLWQEEEFLQEAELILTDIWEKETVTVDGRKLLLAGNWVDKQGLLAVNPSYFAPYAFRIFAQAQPEVDWSLLVDDSYYFLDQCTSYNDENQLPGNWCFINQDGEVEEDDGDEFGLDNTIYSYDALRIPWRISLDYFWFNDQQALDFLLQIDFFRQEWAEDQHLYTAYTITGEVDQQLESLSFYSSLLGYFELLNKDASDQIYQQKIKPSLNLEKKGTYWGQENNYYDQNWVWLGLALKENYLQNLWEIDFSNNNAIINTGRLE